MLKARLCDFAYEALRNLGGLGDAASFRNQARDIGTRGQIATFIQWLDTEPDC